MKLQWLHCFSYMRDCSHGAVPHAVVSLSLHQRRLLVVLLSVIIFDFLC